MSNTEPSLDKEFFEQDVDVIISTLSSGFEKDTVSSIFSNCQKEIQLEILKACPNLLKTMLDNAQNSLEYYFLIKYRNLVPNVTLETFDYLLNEGLDVNLDIRLRISRYTHDHAKPLLHLALSCNQDEFYLLLLNNGADIHRYEKRPVL